MQATLGTYGSKREEAHLPGRARRRVAFLKHAARPSQVGGMNHGSGREIICEDARVGQTE